VYLFAMKSLGQLAIQFYRLFSSSKEHACPFVINTTWNCNLTGLQTTLAHCPLMTGRWLLFNFVIRSLDTRHSVKGNIIFPSIKFHLELKQAVIMKCSSLVILVILKIVSCVLFHSYK
jgi:hypothetical protein